jgi:ABC-type bacteriocin/lantibiotic exporter with double-glycine peptidase domain
MKLINLPDVLQNEDYSCGVFVSQVLMSYWKEDWIEDELNKELNPDKEFGTSTKDIIKFFKSRGLKVTSGSMSVEQLKKYIDKDIPVIMLIQAWDFEDDNPEWLNEEYGHYVIAVGYNDKAIIIEDPAIFGRGYITYSDLEKRWHGEDESRLDHYGIVVVGKEHFNFDKNLVKIEGKLSLKKILFSVKENYKKNDNNRFKKYNK